MQANISTLQTTLLTNTSSPTLVQVTSSNDLPSSDSRVLVQFNSLAATASSSVLPSDVAAMDMVINSTFLPNVDTHVLHLDNTTANVSDVVTALRARDGINLPCSQLLQLCASAKRSCALCTIMQFGDLACFTWLAVLTVEAISSFDQTSSLWHVAHAVSPIPPSQTSASSCLWINHLCSCISIVHLRPAVGLLDGRLVCYRSSIVCTPLCLQHPALLHMQKN